MKHDPHTDLRQRFVDWVNGDWEWERESPIQTLEERPPAPTPEPREKDVDELLHLRQQMIAYALTAVLVCLVMMAALLYTVSCLPAFGSADSPMLNEVSERYVEQGVEETGAVNVVAGLILDYRAFDTFGESTVLFAAASAVLFLIQRKRPQELAAKSAFTWPNRDPIFQTVGKLLLPFIFLFGIYVVLNGHLSPGGGFSGGAILGGGLILLSSIFGQEKLGSLLNLNTTTRLSVGCLLVYAALKGYSFFTGANHVGWEIPKGTPGNILSAGFILPLNICVGIIVACTMYSFYALFSQGEEV